MSSLCRTGKRASGWTLNAFVFFRYYTCGVYFGKILCIVIAVQCIFLWFLDLLYPADRIDLAPAIHLDAESVDGADDDDDHGHDVSGSCPASVLRRSWELQFSDAAYFDLVKADVR